MAVTTNFLSIFVMIIKAVIPISRLSIQSNLRIVSFIPDTYINTNSADSIQFVAYLASRHTNSSFSYLTSGNHKANQVYCIISQRFLLFINPQSFRFISHIYKSIDMFDSKTWIRIIFE